MATEPIDPRGAVQRLGEYRLHGVLGEGGMGVVHLGVDPSGRAVAVKVLRDHVAHDRTARARLAREVATLRRVDHPAVAPFLGADVDGPRPYLVTRYVPGEPLDAWVREHGPLRGAELRAVGRTLTSALEAIHAAGVVHRDLKPGNVLMPDGSPVLIDFGIAHVADESRLTSTGLVMGTPGYLAPELLDGDDVSPATDLWGLAATLAFAASGRPPFGVGRTEAVLDRVRRGAADLSGLEPWLQQLVHAGLDPDPRRRPPLRTVRRVLDDPALARTELPPLPASFSTGATAGSSAGASGATSGASVGGGATEVVAAPSRGDAGGPLGSAPTEVVARGAGDPGPATERFARPASAASTAAGDRGTGNGGGGDGRGTQGLRSPRAWVDAVRGRVARPATDAATDTADTADTATATNPVVSTRVMPVVTAPAPPRPEQHEPRPAAPRYAPFHAGRSHGASVPPGVPRHGGASVYPYPPQPRGPVASSPAPAPAPAPRPARPVSARGGSLLALGLLLVALVGYRPGLGILVALGWSCLARVTDRLVTTVLLRRAARGPRDTDLAVAALASPWHLLGAAFSALVTGLVPLLVGAGLVVGLRAMAGDVTGLPLGLSSTLMVGAAAGLIVAWWGPGGATLRRGARVVVRSVAPGRIGALVVTVSAGVAAAVVALLTQSSGWELSWWPLDGLRRLLPALARAVGL